MDDDERLHEAWKEIGAILDKYRVEFCAEYEQEMWLEVREEDKEPTLRLVQ